jgi:hypothetical protein
LTIADRSPVSGTKVGLIIGIVGLLSGFRGGVLKGFSWICPLGPGCVYDIRNGARLDGGPGLKCHPVRTTKTGGLQIGFGLPFEPKLPAF